MPNWLITGGCGFIGSNLIRRLQADKPEATIRVVDDLSEGGRNDLRRVAPSFRESDPNDVLPISEPGVELVPADIRDRDIAEAVCAGADYIVHLAAVSSVPKSVQDPMTDCTTNVIGTLNYLEAARTEGVKRFVFASSVAPIGDAEPPIHENMPANPKAPYGASKLAGEGYCSAYAEAFGVPTVALRFANVYGPLAEEKETVIPKFVRRALNGEAIEVYGDGKQTRDYVHTDDLVRAIILSARLEGSGAELFQIATNSETTINDLLDFLLPILEDEAGIDDIKVVYTDPRTGDIRRNYADTRRAEKRLGWTPKVSLKEGLTSTVRSFLQYYANQQDA